MSFFCAFRRNRIIKLIPAVFKQNMCHEVNPVKLAVYADVISDNSYVIDVREHTEISESGGSIQNSINIPLGELESALKLPNNEFQSKYGRKKPHFDDEIILSCHFGKRSQIAAEIAIKNQFNNVKNYSGGWSDYSIKSKST